MRDARDEACLQEFTIDAATLPVGTIAYMADGDQEFVHINKCVVDLFECASALEFMELTGGSFAGFVYEGDRMAVEDSVCGGGTETQELAHRHYRVRTKSGRLVMVDDFARFRTVAEDGRPVWHAFVAPMREVDTVDWLTGLPKMGRFYEIARISAESLSRRGERPAAVALDLMGMKTFRSENGREASNELLRTFSEELRKEFGGESCSRFFDDHFYAFGPMHGMEERLERVFASYEAACQGGFLPVRAGVYACDPGDDIATVGFDRARVACDLDRTTWRSHITWFTARMRTEARLQLYMLEHLDEAIEKGYIRPLYQEVVRSFSGEVCGEEALARWRDPSFGAILPGHFITILENAGVCHKLDLHIVDCVLADFVERRELGQPIVPVSVNISPSDLTAVDMPEELARRADAAGVPRSLLRVEIAESAASEYKDVLREQIDAFHEKGFEVWMDDFGVGNSSLALLPEFDFDLIKLDMSFMHGSSPERSQAIVEGIVRIAGKLGVGTLAEGVETREQAEFLERIGCDMLQGYFCSAPDVFRKSRGTVNDGSVRLERISERDYADAVSLVDLSDSSMMGEVGSLDQTPGAELPSGVVECREGRWLLLRGNETLLSLLQKERVLPEEFSTLRAMPLAEGLEESLNFAAHRCLGSGGWERVFNPLKFGSGYHLFIRHAASAEAANAFLLMGAPTMLGAILGSYGDVPIAYAVFRVILNDAGDEVVDAEYVYANELYREWGGFGGTKLTGRSFLETARDASPSWFPYCYRAAVLGERVHDIMYSPETGHWLNFNIAPSSVEGCCVFAFALADDERRSMEELEAASQRDQLTGLLNRRGIDMRIGALMSEDPAQPYVLALMDVDDFKTVNDMHGHDVGDEALRTLARVVVDALPESTIVGRNGGDEFLAMFHGEDVMRAQECLERLASLEKSCVYRDRRYPLSLSIGYVTCPEQVQDLQGAYSKADAALYSVKLSGKAGIKRYAVEMEGQYRSQLGFTPRDISENIPGGIVVHRVEGDKEILFANDELAEMFECEGLSDFMAFVGGSFVNMVHPDDRDRVERDLTGQVELDDVGAKDFVDYRICTKRGNVRRVANNGRLVQIDGIGKVFYELLINYDERSVVRREDGE